MPFKNTFDQRRISETPTVAVVTGETIRRRRSREPERRRRLVVAEVSPALCIEMNTTMPKISTMNFRYRRIIIATLIRGEEEEEEDGEAKIENFSIDLTAEKVVKRERDKIILTYTKTHITHDIHFINHELLSGARSL